MRPDEQAYFAHKYTRGERVTYLHASPSRQWVDLHGLSEPVVTLRLRERAEGDPPSGYWAWVYADKPDCYAMVWPSRAQLDMCFPYGPQAEEARGRGRVVNLIVEEVQP